MFIDLQLERISRIIIICEEFATAATWWSGCSSSNSYSEFFDRPLVMHCHALASLSVLVWEIRYVSVQCDGEHQPDNTLSELSYLRCYRKTERNVMLFFPSTFLSRSLLAWIYLTVYGLTEDSRRNTDNIDQLLSICSLSAVTRWWVNEGRAEKFLKRTAPISIEIYRVDYVKWHSIP